MSEASLNSEVSSMALTAEDWEQMMGTKWPDFRLIESRHVKVDNQPALLGVVEHSQQTVDRKTYIKGSMLAAFTPGHMFLVSCAGKGDTQTEARESFAHWDQTFQRMQGSLVFESRFNAGDSSSRPPSKTLNANAAAQLGGYLLVTAAINVLGIVSFWYALRRLSPKTRKPGNLLVLAVVAATAILHFASKSLSSALSGLCMLLLLLSIPLWIIGMFVRRPGAGTTGASAAKQSDQTK